MTDNPHLVYCKTAKGHEEISNRHHGLLSRQRSTLILMDCAKSIGIIANAIPLPELQQTVPFLMQSGFIVLADEQREQANRIELKPKQRLDDINLVATASKPAIITPPPQLNQTPEVVESVKHFMITTANTYLGLMGAEVISRIQRCHNADQLMAAVAHWHMALRDSKIGAAFAADFLEQVKFELHSGN